MEELNDALHNANTNGKRVSAAPTFNVRIGKVAYDFSGAQKVERWISIFEQIVQLVKAQ